MALPTRKSCVVWIDPIPAGADFATACRGRVEDVATSVRRPFNGVAELLALVERLAGAAPMGEYGPEGGSDG